VIKAFAEIIVPLFPTPGRKRDSDDQSHHDRKREAEELKWWRIHCSDSISEWELNYNKESSAALLSAFRFAAVTPWRR
jgi:hypothetical protein